MQKHDRRGWGRIRKLPSGRVQAGYTGPDEQVHYAAVTFQGRNDAEAWLAAEHRMIELDTWTAPSQRAVGDDPEITLGEYASSWLDSGELKPRARFHYERMIDRLIKPALGDRHLDELTPVRVRSWHTRLLPGRPTMRAHTYSLLRSVLSSAVEDQLIATNPARSRAPARASVCTRSNRRQRKSSTQLWRRCRSGIGLQCCCPLGAHCGSAS